MSPESASIARQRVAVVGGGPMGVALALELARRGHDATLYEADDRLGGLSTWEDFGPLTWDRFYHCVLPTDRDLLALLRELGLEGELRWRKTSTGVYIDGRSYPLDTGVDFARFSALTLTERARLAWTLVRCFLVRDVRSLEGTTAEEWFVRVGGARPYERIWLPLLRAKFGEAADRVSPVFLVAKVKRMLTARSDVRGAENLGYVSGGYKAVWDRAAEVLAERGARVALSTRVEAIEPAAEGGAVVHAAGAAERFDRVILTVPFEASRTLTSSWPAPGPVPETARVEYMGLVCLVLAMRREVFPNYVMNIADPGFPFTGVIGMTNLVDSSEVGGYSLAYVPAYVSATDPLLAAPDAEVFERAYEGLQRLYPDLTRADIAHWWVRRAEVVQPVQGIGYSQHAPQPDFSRGPVTVVNNAQLLETDLNNGRVVLHAHEAVDALERHEPTPPSAPLTHPDPPCVRFVLPAYNEAASIGPLIDRIAETMRGDGHEYRIYVVDDGSADDTSAVASARGDAGAEVTVVRNDPNRGLGFTIARGLRVAAAESGPDDVIVTMDADLTHDPRFTLRMLDRYREGADVVIASRFRRGSLEIGVSRLRLMLTRGARLFYGTLVPVEGVRDYSCGYRLYRASLISDAFDRLGDDFITEPGFACMVEIAGKLRRSATFAEVPFVLHYEEKLGASSMTILPTIWAYIRVVRHVWEMDLAGKLGPRPRTPRRAYALLLGVIVLAVLGQTLLKTGVTGLDGATFARTIASALLEPLVLLGVASYAASAALWLAVLTQMNLSVAYPMGAASYVLVVAAARLMGENVPPARWGGVAAIVIGIALIGAGFELNGREDA